MKLVSGRVTWPATVYERAQHRTFHAFLRFRAYVDRQQQFKVTRYEKYLIDKRSKT